MTPPHVAWHRLALPAIILQCGWLALFALTATSWLVLTPSPLTVGLIHWHAPAHWDPALGPVGTVAPDVAWHLFFLAVLLVGLAVVAVWAVHRAQAIPQADRRILHFVLGATALMGLTLVLLPVLPSDDLFSYALYGRISVLYHLNPLQVTPGQFTGDPFLGHIFWKDTRSVYGPVWLLASAVITWLAQLLGDSVAVYVALYKLLGLGCHLANAALIWGILTRIAPERRLAGTLLYAWNPLPLLEFAGGAHNDALMITLFLLGIWFLTRGQELPALVAWGASIATKYVLIVLLPLWLWQVALTIIAQQDESIIHLWQRRFIAVAWRGSAVLGTAVILALPFWAGPSTLEALVFSPPALHITNSLMDAVSWPLSWLARDFIHGPAARADTITVLKALGVLCFLAIWAVQLLRRAGHDIYGAWSWALVGYLVLASGWFWPWYATWPLAVVALRPLDRLSRAVLVLAGGVLTLYGFLPVTAAPIFGYRAFVAFGPALAYLAWDWHRERRAQRAVMRRSDTSVTGAIPARLGR